MRSGTFVSRVQGTNHYFSERLRHWNLHLCSHCFDLSECLEDHHEVIQAVSHPWFVLSAMLVVAATPLLRRDSWSSLSDEDPTEAFLGLC